MLLRTPDPLTYRGSGHETIVKQVQASFPGLGMRLGGCLCKCTPVILAMWDDIAPVAGIHAAQ